MIVVLNGYLLLRVTTSSTSQLGIGSPVRNVKIWSVINRNDAISVEGRMRGKIMSFDVFDIHRFLDPLNGIHIPDKSKQIRKIHKSLLVRLEIGNVHWVKPYEGMEEAQV